MRRARPEKNKKENMNKHKKTFVIGKYGNIEVIILLLIMT